jgi:hypothetical protein
MKIIFETEYEKSYFEKLFGNIYDNSARGSSDDLCDCLADLVIWIAKAETEVQQSDYTELSVPGKFPMLPYKDRYFKK